MGRDSGQTNPPTFQLDKEQHVVGNQAFERKHFHREKVGRHQYRHVSPDKVFPTGRLLPLGGAIKRRWRRCWPCPNPHSTCALDSPSPSYNASPRRSAIPKPPSVCSRPSANSSSNCGLPASKKNEARGSKGGGNDGGCET